jgi:hypothetical protein
MNPAAALLVDFSVVKRVDSKMRRMDHLGWAMTRKIGHWGFDSLG